jgi:hypothetical protein
MFWFRQCPRCSGDIYVDRDQYGPYITCIQCGFSRDVPNSSQGPTVISAEPVPAPVVLREEGGRRRRISHGGRHFAKTVEFDLDPLTEIAA